MTHVLNKPRTILCIDDDADDLQLLAEAVQRIDPQCQIIKAFDGMHGISILQEMHTHRELPCLIVMDINMPKLDGKQTFVRIQSDAVLSTIPVVVFSTSSSPMDKMFFQNKGAAFITKPIRFEQLLEVASELLTYCAP
jgi:CheY-like chemotaxis protein